MQEKHREQTTQFLLDLNPSWWIKFRSISKDGIAKTIDSKEAFTNEVDNIYFIWWVKPDAEKIRDVDIDIIHYLRFDIDIKKQVKDTFWTEPSKEEIIDFIDEIKKVLSINHLFNEWSYIVYSWSWCHIYYKNKKWIALNEEFTPRMFSYAMRYIYKRYDTIIWDSHLYSDTAVCNTARIMRLPWTLNQKNWEVSEILYSQDIQSEFFNYLQSMWEKELKIREQRQQQQKKDLEELKYKILDTSKSVNTLYEVINKIPAYVVVEILIPDFPYDWRRNFKNNNRWLTWYYYVEESNTICNWWSRYFDWWTDASCWNNFSLVKRYFDYTNAETFQWFKNIFKF